MRGLVFTLLEDVVTDAHGPAAWDDVLREAGLEGGWTSLGEYPEAELDQLLDAAARRGLQREVLEGWLARRERPPRLAPDADEDPARLRRRLERERRARVRAEVLGAELEARATQARRLLADALAVEDRRGARLVQLLQDYAMQSLLAARQDLEEAAETGDGASLRQGLRAVETAIQQLRETVGGLHPVALDHAGLAVALQELARSVAERSGVPVEVETDGSVIDDQEILLLAVARQLLDNAVRHAGASRISVRLSSGGGTARLEVVDDGAGMDGTARGRAVAEGRVGLATAAERVSASGGRLDLRSGPGEGTRVEVELPVRRGRDR